MKLNNVILTALLALGLAACQTNPVTTVGPADESGTTDSGRSANVRGIGDEGMSRGREVPTERRREALTRVIYFDFDQSSLRPEYRNLLTQHAGRLSGNSRTGVRLEGHADERGSREYNIGLGERRSQTVRRLLLLQGATTNQISTVSFGEERPAAGGSDEESYELNRRVEIKYSN